MHGAELVDDTPDAVRDPSSEGATAGSAAPARRIRSWRWGATWAVVAVFPLFAMVLSLARSGWRPAGDEAVIAWRSWDVFTAHPPLVGQFTVGGSLGSNQSVFDPGPLLYEVIALPARLAPGIGPAIAVQLLVALSLLVACTAAVSVAGRWAGLGVAAGGLLLEWSLAAQLAGTPTWNPYAPLVPFAAMLVLAWAAAAGRLWWMVPLVFLSSFCIQAHLMFVVPSAAVLLVSFLSGVFAARGLHARVVRPTLVAVVVGVVCWTPSVVQELRPGPGNLTLLSRSNVSEGVFGWDFALRQLSRGLNPATLVWLRPPKRNMLPGHGPGGVAGLLTITSVLVILLALALLTVLAWRQRRYPAAGLALVALTADLATLFFFSRFPTGGALSFNYVQNLVWPVGLFTWGALVTAAVAAVRAGRMRPTPDAALGARGRRRVPGFSRGHATAPWAVAGLTVVSLIFAVFLYDAAPRYELKAGERPDEVAAAARLVALVPGPPQPGQRLFIRVPVRNGFDALMDISWEMAAAYQLRTQGWTPVVTQDICQQLEPVYCGRPDDRTIQVGDEVPPGAQLLGTIPAPSGPHPTLRQVWIMSGRS